jgi:hypothetical protein
MNREIHVRLCERLGAKFSGPTRRRVGDHSPYADSAKISVVEEQNQGHGAYSLTIFVNSLPRKDIIARNLKTQSTYRWL